MTAFYSRHAKRVYSVALRVLREPSSAEDVLQEVFVQIWRNPQTFSSGRGDLGSWLGVVAKNRAIDTMRRKKATSPLEEVSLRSRQDVAADVENGLTLERLKQLFTSLPSQQQEALELAFFQGLTHSEIAKRTGDPLGTVKTRIRVGLQTLRKNAGVSP